MDWGFKPIESISALERGDIVRPAGSYGWSYVVDFVLGDTAIAIRTAQLSNCAEWEVLRKIVVEEE